jgi:hypothetical protein
MPAGSFAKAKRLTESLGHKSQSDKRTSLLVKSPPRRTKAATQFHAEAND